MPGVDLNLDLPSLSDTMADVVAKLVVALGAIEDDLAARVVPSELDINAALSMAGNSLTDVGSVQLVGGNVPSAAGSLYYHSDGEFYLITAAGTVRVTLNGAMDITDAGGIVGDYGNGNEAVSYDNTSGEYRFTEDTDVWADIVCDDLVLMGDNGSVRLGVDDAISSARQFIFKDLPASGVSALVYDASESTVESAENTRITNDFKATTGDFSSNLTLGGDFYHGEITVWQGSKEAYGSLSAGLSTNQAVYTVGPGGTANIAMDVPFVAGVSRLKKLELVFENNTLPTLTCVLNTPTSVAGIAISSSAFTYDNVAVGAAHTRLTATFNSPTTVHGRAFFRVLNNNGGADLDFTILGVTYDAVA